MLTLGEARALAGSDRASIEGGAIPTAINPAERQQAELKSRVVVKQRRLDLEALWQRSMRLVASQLRSRAEKDRASTKLNPISEGSAQIDEDTAGSYGQKETRPPCRGIGETAGASEIVSWRLRSGMTQWGR